MSDKDGRRRRSKSESENDGSLRTRLERDAKTKGAKFNYRCPKFEKQAKILPGSYETVAKKTSSEKKTETEKNLGEQKPSSSLAEENEHKRVSSGNSMDETDLNVSVQTISSGSEEDETLRKQKVFSISNPNLSSFDDEEMNVFYDAEEIVKQSDKSFDLTDFFFDEISDSSFVTEGQLKELITSIMVPQIDYDKLTVSIRTAIECSQMPKFDMIELTDDNYHRWAIVCESALRISDLWVDPSINVGSDEHTLDVKDKSSKAAMFVSIYLAGSNIEILNETNRDCFIKLWKDIEEAHRPSATTRSIDLWSKLMKIKYESDMLTMKEHLLNLEHFFGQFDRIKQPLSDLNKAAIMMSSVQESTEFDSLFAALLLAKEEDLNVKKVKEVLLSHKTEFSLQERRHGRSQRSIRLKDGRREENLFSKHDYVENKNRLFSNSTTNMKIKIEIENAKTEWIVDSGANIHVTKTKQLLTDYHESKRGFVII
jgi:gag-polypeptide of LTR copia-type